jgi:transglutaminase-like putative cysteine protease
VLERGQSHAWAEVWADEWLALDPTNGETPGLRHVVVAHGRDYGDVAPLRGIYSGGSAHALDVVVELTRLA